LGEKEKVREGMKERESYFFLLGDLAFLALDLDQDKKFLLKAEL
jgi:hypothetical protein